MINNKQCHTDQQLNVVKNIPPPPSKYESNANNDPNSHFKNGDTVFFGARREKAIIVKVQRFRRENFLILKIIDSYDPARVGLELNVEA